MSTTRFARRSRRQARRSADRTSGAGRHGLARRIAVATLSTLIACGGGGGSDDGSSGSSVESGATLEIFQASIDAVDPVSPGAVITIDAEAAEIDPDVNPVGAVSVLGGTFGGGGLESAQVEWIVYPREDGTLQRVSTERGSAVPQPIRISSEDAALPYCDAVVANSPSDPLLARLAYGTGETDCDGLLDWKIVTLGDDQLTAPVAFPGEPLEALIDPRTGEHRGWLALDGGNLDRLDPNLSVVTSGLVTGVVRGEAIGSTEDGTLFLELDQRLYAYDPGSNRLKDLHFEFDWDCSCRAALAAGRDIGFLIDAGVLYRADPDGGRVRRFDAPDDALGRPDPSDFVVLGARHVGWSYIADLDGDPLTTDDRERVIRILGLDGSAARTFDRYEPAPTPLPAVSGFVAAASDEWLYYNRVSADFATPTTIATLLEGGRSRISSPALFVGSSTEPVLLPVRTGHLKRLFRLRGLRDHPELGSSGRLHLESVDPTQPRTIDEFGDETYVDDVELGQFDADALFAYVSPGFGPSRLGVVLSDDGVNPIQSDVFHFDENTAGSIRRLTATSDRSERVGEGF